MNWADRFFYKAYKSAYPSALHRKNKSSKAAMVATGGLISSAIFGLNTQEGIVYQLFTLLSLFYLTALFSSLCFKGRFTAQRQLPDIATAGEKFTYTVTVTNPSNRVQKNLIIQEAPKIKFPSLSEFSHARAPVEKHLRAWDRMVRFHRFNWLMCRHTRISPTEHNLPDIGANSHVTAFIELTALQRGYLDLPAVLIKRTDPLGLFKGCIKVPTKDRLLILPKRYPLPPITLPGSRKHHAGGITQASSIGNADEFHSLREYNPGDPIKMLHWKSVAKTGELIIRENEDQFFVRHALILDTFQVEPTTARFETAISIAASLACSTRTQDSMLDLMFVEDKAYCFSTGRNIDHTSKMLEMLACMEPCTHHSFKDLYPLVAEHCALLSGCICIFQSWNPERRELIKILQERGVPVKILIVTEGEEQIEDNEFNLQLIDANAPEEGLTTL